MKQHEIERGLSALESIAKSLSQIAQSLSNTSEKDVEEDLDLEIPEDSDFQKSLSALESSEELKREIEKSEKQLGDPYSKLPLPPHKRRKS